MVRNQFCPQMIIGPSLMRFSNRIDVAKECAKEDPNYANDRLSFYFREPIMYLLNGSYCQMRYSRSIIKVLLDSGATVRMTYVQNSPCWIVRRMMLQHMPSIARTAHQLDYLYRKAPKAEQEWFKHFTGQRIRFVLSVTPELIQRATEVQATPPLYVGGIVIPGRQGYQDAISHAVNAGLIVHEMPIQESVRCPILEEPEPEDEPPVKHMRSKFYNHPLWPSPRAKRYVLALKKHPNFTSSWQASGLPQKITHDTCLAYIAWLLRISLEELLTTPQLSHPLIK